MGTTNFGRIALLIGSFAPYLTSSWVVSPPKSWITAIKRHQTSSASPRTFSLSEISIERFIGEATYTVVDTFEKRLPGQVESASSLGVGPQLVSKGRSSTRIFQASRQDASIRSRGGDPRCFLFEVAGPGRRGGKDTQRTVDASVTAAASLDAEWERRQSSLSGGGGLFSSLLSSFSGPPPDRPYTVLLGEYDVPPESQQQIDGGDWTDQLGTTPPRANARWLVYEFDGTSTVASFSVPTATRVNAARNARERLGRGAGLGLPPLPEAVPWEAAAKFAVAGVMKKSLEALALLHESGLAHRSVCGEALVLSAQSQDKGTALQRCDSDLLVVKLGILGFSSPLSESSPGSLASAARWLPATDASPSTSSSPPSFSTIALASLSVAEDLHALGLTFLALLLGTLAEAENGSGSSGDAAAAVPGLQPRDLERLLDGAFAADDDAVVGFGSGGFADYIASDPQRTRAVKLLEANGRCGWNFLGELLSARQFLKSRPKFTVPSTRALVDHPFLKM
mmetsp:Transcript_17704/g.36250  ORF Transcript_17704/g.36250 Transcript_17704/m.36250 type:complete len:510 (-) Transcript_17704:172-1701(-)